MIYDRGEIVIPTNQVNLTVAFKDSMGNYVDPDSFPQISIVQPGGSVALAPTSVGVAKIAVGKYSYIMTAPIDGPLGVWNDIWVAYISGFRFENVFSFVINNGQIPENGYNSDGYAALGDEVSFNYSQPAIKNINKLIKALKARLNSSGKSKSKDAYGNVVYVDCDIFSVDMLVTFIGIALWDFNQVPYFTAFSLDDDNFINQFGEILVEGATLYALASIALVERGREFTLSDNGLSFTPPTESELLNTQYSTLLTHYWDKLKYIKNSLRPYSISIGEFNMMSSPYSPLRRMRHLKERRII